MAQVHRLHEKVAFYTVTGETVYMTVKEARAFAGAIFKAARSIERETYAQSTGLTFNMEFQDE